MPHALQKVLSKRLGVGAEFVKKAELSGQTHVTHSHQTRTVQQDQIAKSLSLSLWAQVSRCHSVYLSSSFCTMLLEISLLYTTNPWHFSSTRKVGWRNNKNYEPAQQTAEAETSSPSTPLIEITPHGGARDHPRLQVTRSLFNKNK